MSTTSGMLSSIGAADLSIGDFQHDALPHPITHIRLLEVSPLVDQNDTTVRCRLKTVRLAEYDQCYTALSYVWFHNDANRTIYVNGRRTSVKGNVHEFLTLYRQKLMLNALPTVFLWIDALCLDYGNTPERNCQVQIMPNIFTKAKTVLAWLQPSPSSVSITDGGAGLRKLAKFMEQVRVDLEQPRNFHNDRYLSTKYCPSPDFSSRYAAEWKLLLQICKHQYWSRLWVLLENRFAQSLMYLHEDVLWSWADFKAPFILMWYLNKLDLYDNTNVLGVDPSLLLAAPALQVIEARIVLEDPESMPAENMYAEIGTERWQLTSERQPLSELLKVHRRRLCSDQSDRIYALVGLSDSNLTIDYDRSNIELFCAVLLNLKLSLELRFVSMLAHHLGIQAFQYQQYRRSIIKGVPSSMVDQSATDLVGKDCHTIYSMRSIQVRTEISDIVQARLGIQKLRYFRVAAQQSIKKMKNWTDFPESGKDMPRMYGHAPGTSIPIVDGFDLSETSFRAAMFVNPASRSNRKSIFGMISTDSIQDGDMLIAEEKMHSGIIVRISGLSKTWLTVIGVVLFARRVTVESEFTSELTPESPASTIRSATLSDFCEHTCPTPFTITGCDDHEHFTLQPHDIQLQSLFSGSGLASGRHSRTSSSTTASTLQRMVSIKVNDRRLTSRSDRIERILDVINPSKRRHSK